MTEKQIATGIKGGIAGVISYLAGLDYELLMYWLILAMADVSIGVIAALRNGEFESRKMRNGLMDKSLVLITILALTIGLRVAEVAGITAFAFSTLIGAFSFMELTSIIETLVKQGWEIPEGIKNWLRVGSEILDNEE